MTLEHSHRFDRSRSAVEKGVLVANGCSGARLSTANYVKLLRPMRLDEYQIGFAEYPWLPAISPFALWQASDPESLPWYGAYNATKHDREGAFDAGTLAHAVTAVCACLAMIAAQYGSPYG